MAPISKRAPAANHVNIQGWEGTHLDPCQLASATRACPATLTPSNCTNAWFIQDYGLYQETTQETRINGRAAFQWRPAENLVVTLDDNYSRDTLHALQYGYSVWFNAGACAMSTQNADGTVTSFVQPNSPTDFQSQVNGSVFQNNDTGLNVKWDASDKLSFTFDYDHSQAWENPGGKLTQHRLRRGVWPFGARHRHQWHQRRHRPAGRPQPALSHGPGSQRQCRRTSSTTA